MSSTFTNALTIVVALAFLVISVGLIFIASRNAFDHNRQITRRLASGGGSDIGDIGIKRKKGLLSRMGDHLTLPDAEEITRIRADLAKAGYYDETAVKSFYAIRVGAKRNHSHIRFARYIRPNGTEHIYPLETEATYITLQRRFPRYDGLDGSLY